MKLKVEISARAARDLKRLYRVKQAGASPAALAWFEPLQGAIYSLNSDPKRGAEATEHFRSSLLVRQLIVGRGRNLFRILYSIDVGRQVVDVLAVRFGGMDAVDDTERLPE